MRNICLNKEINANSDWIDKLIAILSKLKLKVVILKQYNLKTFQSSLCEWYFINFYLHAFIYIELQCYL